MAFLQSLESTLRGHARGTTLVLAVLTAILPACSTRGRTGERQAPGLDAAAASAAMDLTRARLLASGEVPVPTRAESLALAQSIEAEAMREGASARAWELHLVSARLFERVWRVEGREQDAREALEVYAALSQSAVSPSSDAACEAALAAARLQGDLSHDAASTYTETYRAARRFASSPACVRRAEDTLALLSAFRPPSRVLEAIDEGLAREGAISAGSAGGDAGTSATPTPRIARVDVWPGPRSARVVIVLDRAAQYRVEDEASDTGAPRTTIDLDGVELGPTTNDLRADGVLTRVHAETTSTGSRVVLDLAGRPWRRVFPMQEPYRLVIDIAREAPGLGHADSARSLARVVLDPGHGGRDTGAVGPSGVREKDVTLDIAHRVAPVLAAQGLQVVLTRDDDSYVSLEERTARANAFGADLFVSIHCNASESKLRRGVETYVLDTTRDEVAARVAARENATSQAASAELSSMLGGMRVAADAKRSSHFAQLLQRAATSAVQLRYGDAIDGGVHTAGFYVLVGARMPSVLFETSYVSSGVEEGRLATADYRQLLADAVINAVRAYRQGR